MSLFLDMLAKGDRKEVGQAGEVASIIFETPPLLEELMDCIVNGNEKVRAHGAHALMQVGTKKPGLLNPFKDRLLAEISGIDQWEVQEQLLKILPKLDFTPDTRDFAIDHCRGQLRHKAAFVKTCALQALADFSRNDPKLMAETRILLEQALETGAKSMQARARKLLKTF